MTGSLPGRDALGRYPAGSAERIVLSAALAAADADQARPPGPRSRAALEAKLGHSIDVIAIRCSGHAVNGKIKRPRVGYAVRFDVESGWYFGGTLSAALDVEANASRSAWAQAVRSASYEAKEESGHERDVLICSGCSDRFVFADGPRIATALVSFLDEGKHTVTIAELRSRY